MITGNKGEWSELYVLLYLLGTGKLYAANKESKKLKNEYFPIIKIMRESLNNQKVDYLLKNESEVEIFINDTFSARLPSNLFKHEADYLYDQIIKGTNRAFSIAKTEEFMKRISTDRLAAPSSDKTDITMKVRDIRVGYEQIMGFSIKSELGNAPTLLNASGATNFSYEILGISDSDMEQINSIETKTKILDRISCIYNKGGNIKYSHAVNGVFSENLMLIDSNMENIIAELLLYSYTKNVTSCANLISDIADLNPLKFPRKDFYSYKFKKLLCAIALGMKPSTVWDGIDEANGGYIVVTTDGNILAYHIYNRNYFEQYLLDNTRLERASTSRHGYASIYKDKNKYYMNLNLQIRFI